MASSRENLFKFRSYKKYLVELEELKEILRKGFRSKLGEAAGCNSAFVSHVLNGAAHFSLEQAFKINAFLGHNEDEAKFFLLLVELERAGTEELRGYFLKQIEMISQARSVIKTRLNVKEKLSLEDKVRYYSSWEYGAIHVIVTIEAYQSAELISQRLQIPRARTMQILGALVNMGLLKKQKDAYVAADGRIHIGSDTELVVQHHSNWRVRVLRALAAPAPQDVHFSSAFTVSKEDVKKLNGMIVDFLAKVNPIIDASPAEEPYGICVDFYRL